MIDLSAGREKERGEASSVSVSVESSIQQQFINNLRDDNYNEVEFRGAFAVANQFMRNIKLLRCVNSRQTLLRRKLNFDIRTV